MIRGVHKESHLGRILSAIASVLVITTLSLCAAGKETHERSEKGVSPYSIEIITMDPGKDLFSRWGHICIMVTDRMQQTRVVYNFGVFDFQDPALALRYAKGYLNFWVEIVPYGPMVAYYRSGHRGMVTRTLDLTDKQAQVIAQRLSVYIRPENRTYAYRHYLDNCCTRIRDLLYEVLGDDIKKQFDTHLTERTFRYYNRRALTGLPVTRNIILFIMGREIDRPITRFGEQFLPEVFAEDLDKITIDGHPLVSERRVLYAPEGPPVGEAPALWEYIVSIVVVLCLVLGMGLPHLLNNCPKWVARSAGFGLAFWGLLAGFGGLLVIFLWTATLHYDCYNNENVLVFPVTHLLLLGPGITLMFKGTISERMGRFLRNYLIVALALLGINLLLKLGPLFQHNYQFIFVAAVMNGSSLLILRRVQSAVRNSPPLTRR